jgi:ribosome biogenesis protein UTP30
MSGGSSLTIRVAISSQDETHCVENIMETLSLAVDKLPGKWSGLKALYLKTAESVALPIWQASLERAQNDIAPKE